ncbi:hypothetical protein [Lacinutrix sp. MEBiC02595]
MKAKLLSSAVLVFLIGIGSIGCSSTTKKNLKVANENRKDTKLTVNRVRKDSSKVIKTIAKVDWDKFKKDAQIAVKQREIQIEDLKREISVISEEDQKCRIAIDTLEQKKNSLKGRLLQINKKFKADMEHLNENDEAIKITFEKSFVHDMNELIMSIRDFCKKE